MYRILLALFLIIAQLPHIPQKAQAQVIPYMYMPLPSMGCPGGKYVYTYTGSLQTHTVPSGCYGASIKIWAAGGGGSWYSATYGSTGGAGGYATANLILTPGETINVVVGGGGSRGMFGQGAPVAGPVTTNPGGWGGGAGAGNGGNGGGYNTAGTIYLAGGGGGASGIYRGVVNTTNSIITIGGGGGAAALSDNGQRDSTTNSMRGSASYQSAFTQCYDGYSNDATGVGIRACANASAGMTGANGTNASGTWLGGGGGGGYNGGYGGGTYASDIGLGGAPGSSSQSAAQGVSGYVFTSGAASAAPGTGDADYTAGVAVGGNSSNNYDGGTGKIVLTYTETDGICDITTAYYTTFTMYTVPEDCTSIGIKIWGGAGAGGQVATGGGGGYVQGIITGLIPGTQIRLYPATGGLHNATYMSGGGGGRGYVTNSNATVTYLIAGGGGGGGRNTAGGAGGGTTGQDGAGAPYGGYGGTQAGGGAAGSGGGTAGSALNGGYGAEWSTSSGGGSYGGGDAGRSTAFTGVGSGGGGGGYYGGGGGGVSTVQWPWYGGGGGSGYYNPTYVTNATLSTGNYATPANSSDADRLGYADGAAAQTNGDGGLVVVTSPSNVLAICSLPWGGTIVEPSSVTAYSTTAGYGGLTATCTTNSESRVCQSSGTLSGTFTNQSCTQYCATQPNDVTISQANDRVYHPYGVITNNQPVSLTNLNGGAPLATSTIYFTGPATDSGKSTNNYVLRATVNGAQINVTSDASAVTQMVEYYSQGTAVDSFSTNTGAAGAANCVASKTTGTCQSSGSFSPALATYLSCGQQCNNPWGGTTTSYPTSDTTVTMYSTPGPRYYPSACSSFAQNRTCQFNTGTFNGSASYQYQTCDQQCCLCTGQQMNNCNPGAGFWGPLDYITNWSSVYCVAGGGTCYTGAGYCWTSQWIQSVTFNCPTPGSPEGSCNASDPSHTMNVVCPGTINGLWNCNGTTCSAQGGYPGEGQICTCW